MAQVIFYQTFFNQSDLFWPFVLRKALILKPLQIIFWQFFQKISNDTFVSHFLVQA